MGEPHGDRGKQPVPSDEAPSETSHLCSLRTLVITVMAVVIGLTTGTATGVSAGLGAAHSSGTLLAVAVGVASGLAAFGVTSISVASTLHPLVGGRS